MSVQDVMTAHPATVTADATVAEVFDLMRERDIRHVPVVEGNIVVGILSDRDLARFDISRLLHVDGAETLRRELGTPVVALMSPDVVVVGPETELPEVIDLLLEHRVGALPVVRPDTGELIGIVSYVDVLDALRESL